MARSLIGLVVVVSFTTLVLGSTCNPNQRSDCGYVGITQDQCVAKECCWQPSSQNGIPWCFYPDNSELTQYALTQVSSTAYGYEGVLSLVKGSSQYGPLLSTLHLSVYFETESRLHVKIYDPNNERWQVPFVAQTQLPTNKPSHMDYSFAYTSSPFGFSVTRVSTGEVIFDTNVPSSFGLNGLSFSDQYIELSTVLDESPNIYGLGEHINPLKLQSGSYTLWNADTGTPTNENVYGSHPFYLDVRGGSGNANGVFMLNSNGMDIILGDQSLTYKMIGGIIDLYIFTGPSPDQVIQQYLQVIGTPYMIPYWSLGFHQCRWGYHDINEIKEVVANYSKYNIPLETMWTDIDYMNEYEDFTFDPVRFPPDQMKQWVDSLHSNHQHYIVIVDPGIHNVNGYEPYEKGLKDDIFIKTAQGNVFIGKVWPGTTAFPDFTNPKAFDYWFDQVNAFLQMVEIDGLWIDMNEISNFCDGECTSDHAAIATSSGFDPNHPPYMINNMNNKNPLYKKTVDMDAIHHLSIEYNVHNLYGYLEAYATKLALEKVRGKRAFVLSRSTFAGSGHHGGHWTGDVLSSWDALYLTIPDMINFNMYGIPFVGADICGFIGDTTEELCARWIEVGAFYPFCRDHNAINQTPQELYVWPTVANISRFILNVRYALLPYYYTLFYQSHSGISGTVVRPLFFEFPQDSKTYSIDKQFLVGNGLLVSPVLTQGATSVSAYFPNANWYDFYTGQPVPYGGKQVTLSAPLNRINVHIRGGVIIPMQIPSYTLYQSRQNPFNLTIAFSSSGSAAGSLYVDDGETINATENGLYSLINYQAAYVNGSGKLYSSVLKKNFRPPTTAVMSGFKFLGVSNSPSSVLVNNQNVKFVYLSDVQVLLVQNLKLDILTPFTVTWN